jgi:hypothetical protein
MNQLTQVRRAAGAQWHRIARVGLAARIVGAMFGLATLISLLAIGRAAHRATTVALGPIRGLPTTAELTSTDGLAACLRSSGVLLGVVIVAMAASVVGGDFERGTIRLWLVFQPSRPAHLAGTVGALAAFAAAAVTVVAALTIPLSYLLAAWRGVDTSAWSEPDAWVTFGGAVVAAIAAALAWVVIGAAVATLSRSVSLSITCVTTLVIVESIVASAWARADRWLPATTIANLAAGGSADQPLARAAAVTAVTAAAAHVAATLVVRRRDVTQ